MTRGRAGRLSDCLAVQYLIKACPPELVEYAISRAGRTGSRTRMLPPWLVVYFVLAMSLFSDAAYEEICRLLGQGLALSDRRQAGWRQIATPSTAAISRARARLGSEPLRELFALTAADAADPADSAGQGGDRDDPATRYRRWRLRTMDGHVVLVPHCQENAAVPRPRGTAAGVRISVLAENGTSDLVAVDVSGDRDRAALGEVPEDLTRALRPGDLLLTSGDYARPGLWRAAAATGADLLWSVPAAVPPLSGAALPDGSRLCVSRGGPWAPAGTALRVLGDTGAGPRKLMTTILDPAQASAAELHAVHGRRWDFRRAEVFRDQAELPLRSRSREMVEQEIWGHLLVYSAIRRLSRSGAAQAG